MLDLFKKADFKHLHALLNKVNYIRKSFNKSKIDSNIDSK